MKKIFSQKLFWVGLSIKIVFLFVQGSHVIDDFFIPFLDKAVLNIGSNPWALSPAHFFPYGSVLFFILALPKLLFYQILGATTLGPGIFGTLLIKGPILILDILLLYFLVRVNESQLKRIISYYWLSPVLFYINYIHGQLDVASTSFVIASLFFMIRGRAVGSALLFAAATLCKFHVVIIGPILLAYIWNRNFSKSAIRKIGLWLGIWISLSALGFLPLLFASRFFYASVNSPEAHRLFAVNIPFESGPTLYLGMLFVLALLGRLCISGRISNFGLIFGSGALFGMLILVTNPMPGWYYWMVPFMTLAFVLYQNIPRTLYYLFNIFYLLYFVALPHFDLGTEIHLVQGMLLTLLQTSVLGFLLVLEVVVLKFEMPFIRRLQPVKIGVAGDSGAGKNHISMCFQNVFSKSQSVILEGDDYHRWERGNRFWDQYSHLNPRANHLIAMARHARELFRGRSITHRQYDHQTGKFNLPKLI